MAAPRNKISKARRNKRSAHSAKKPKMISKCSNCTKEKLPHRICPYCGYYANKVVINHEEKAND